MKRLAAVAMAFLGVVVFLGLVAAGCGSSTTTTVTTRPSSTAGSTATGGSSSASVGRHGFFISIKRYRAF